MSDLIVLLVLLALGFVFGTTLEKRHFKSIIKREKQLKDILVIPEKSLPDHYQGAGYQNHLVDGSVVVSVDYFKRFVSGLRALVGGRVRSYETLLERARREALLRMKQKAFQSGAVAVFNCKLETSSISKGQKDSIGSVEVHAYGTAIIPATQLGTN